MRTKIAGEQPTISLFGLGGYTPILNGRTAYQTGGTIGKRFTEAHIQSVLKKNFVLFCGTVPLIGGAFRFGRHFSGRLSGGPLKSALTIDYDIA